MNMNIYLFQQHKRQIIWGTMWKKGHNLEQYHKGWFQEYVLKTSLSLSQTFWIKIVQILFSPKIWLPVFSDKWTRFCDPESCVLQSFSPIRPIASQVQVWHGFPETQAPFSLAQQFQGSSSRNLPTLEAWAADCLTFSVAITFKLKTASHRLSFALYFSNRDLVANWIESVLW